MSGCRPTKTLSSLNERRAALASWASALYAAKRTTLKNSRVSHIYMYHDDHTLLLHIWYERHELPHFNSRWYQVDSEKHIVTLPKWATRFEQNEAQAWNCKGCQSYPRSLRKTINTMTEECKGWNKETRVAIERYKRTRIRSYPNSESPIDVLSFCSACKAFLKLPDWARCKPFALQIIELGVAIFMWVEQNRYVRWSESDMNWEGSLIRGKRVCKTLHNRFRWGGIVDQNQQMQSVEQVASLFRVECRMEWLRQSGERKLLKPFTCTIQLLSPFWGASNCHHLQLRWVGYERGSSRGHRRLLFSGTDSIAAVPTAVGLLWYHTRYEGFRERASVTILRLVVWPYRSVLICIETSVVR